jgi:hypothetical protein
MPVGSVDSGLGGDIDDGRGSRTRSSSEEKESLTPAQSRRKAQNRAAYVVLTCSIKCVNTDFVLDNARFVSGKSGT